MDCGGKYMRIKLNTVNDIDSFITACSNYYEGEIDVKQGRQTIDGKSILGIYSLNLMKPLEVSIDTQNKDTEQNFYNFIKKWYTDVE